MSQLREENAGVAAHVIYLVVTEPLEQVILKTHSPWACTWD